MAVFAQSQESKIILAGRFPSRELGVSRLRARYIRLRRFSNHGFEGLTIVGPPKQPIHVTVRMTDDDPAEAVGQLAKRVDVVQHTGLARRGDPALTTSVGVCQQRMASSSVPLRNATGCPQPSRHPQS